MLLHFGLVWLLAPVITVAATSALHVTPFINNGTHIKARSLSAVDPSLFLGVKSYSGFITVNEKYDSNIFFWYFPVAGKPVKKTPWILWLQGGPGASSLTGLFDEIGPFEYDSTTQQLKLREYAWTKLYSMVFIDNPVGAGFSYTNDTKGYAHSIETCTAHLEEALRQFLIMFKELIDAPAYMAGESYAGVFLPALGVTIQNQVGDYKYLNINLKGVIMGNPLMSRLATADYTLAHYKWGLIDSNAVTSLKPLQDTYINAIKEGQARPAYQLRSVVLDQLMIISQQHQIFNALQDGLTIDLEAYVEFLNQMKIRDALHVGAKEFSITNSSVRRALAREFLAGGAGDTMKLLEKYKVLIYCGNLDLMIPCVEDAHFRRVHWDWNGVAEFLEAPRKPWSFDESRVGYVKEGGRLTEVLVLGAGHMVAVDKPVELFYLIRSFIEGLTLPTHSGMVPKPNDMTATKPESPPGAGWFMLSLFINVLFIIISCRCVIFWY